MSEQPVFERIKGEVDENSRPFHERYAGVSAMRIFIGLRAGSGNLGISFKGINVLEDGEVREGIKAYSNWPTIPQLYVKGEFVGGCDIVREMYESGELIEYFNTSGISVELANPE